MQCEATHGRLRVRFIAVSHIYSAAYQGASPNKVAPWANDRLPDYTNLRQPARWGPAPTTRLDAARRWMGRLGITHGVEGGVGVSPWATASAENKLLQSPRQAAVLMPQMDET